MTTDKISGFAAAEPVAPIKGSNSNGVVADKLPSNETGANAAAQAGDQVTLTNNARSLQKLEESIANAPVVDLDKVQSIKQSIGAGTYQINAASIANKLLQFERGLK